MAPLVKSASDLENFILCRDVTTYAMHSQGKNAEGKHALPKIQSAQTKTNSLPVNCFKKFQMHIIGDLWREDIRESIYILYF